LRNLRYVHPFPTRRSSDLLLRSERNLRRDFELRLRLRLPEPAATNVALAHGSSGTRCADSGHRGGAGKFFARARGARLRRDLERSEEHTSELQSLAYLVCR